MADEIGCRLTGPMCVPVPVLGIGSETYVAITAVSPLMATLPICMPHYHALSILNLVHNHLHRTFNGHQDQALSSGNALVVDGPAKVLSRLGEPSSSESHQYPPTYALLAQSPVPRGSWVVSLNFTSEGVLIETGSSGDHDVRVGRMETSQTRTCPANTVYPSQV